MAEEIYHFKLGNFDCTIFTLRNRILPADQMYASVPDDERERVVAEFGLGEGVPSAFNVLLVDTGESKILIDTGLGQGLLSAGLEQEGIQNSDIDHIIITHGHGDHIGGILDEGGNLVFSNAQYWVGKTEWEGWDGSGDSFSELQERVRAALPSDRTHIVDGEAEFMPGFSAMFIPGHCKGMMGVVIESSGERALHIADVMHHAVQVKYPEWCVNFDRDKPVARESRRRVWQRSADENMLVISYHVWQSGRGRVVPDGESWTWQAETSGLA